MVFTVRPTGKQELFKASAESIIKYSSAHFLNFNIVKTIRIHIICLQSLIRLPVQLLCIIKLCTATIA